MDSAQLKQRIVGAIVLVALGVIFIPMILNREDTNSGISGTNIPLKPSAISQLANQATPSPPPAPAQPQVTRQIVDKNTPPLPKASPIPPQGPSPVVNPTPVVTPKNSIVQTSPTAAPVSPHSWVVQIASLTDRQKALKLRDRLRKAKYTCYVEAITGRRGTFYRVRVGPVIERTAAERLQEKLARQFKLRGSLVMPHR